jgi:hypothetical protein
MLSIFSSLFISCKREPIREMCLRITSVLPLPQHRQANRSYTGHWVIMSNAPEPCGTRSKPEVRTGVVRVVVDLGKSEILKAERLKSGPGRCREGETLKC